MLILCEQTDEVVYPHVKQKICSFGSQDDSHPRVTTSVQSHVFDCCGWRYKMLHGYDVHFFTDASQIDVNVDSQMDATWRCLGENETRVLAWKIYQQIWDKLKPWRLGCTTCWERERESYSIYVVFVFVQQDTVLRLDLLVPHSFVFVCRGRVCMVVLLCNGLYSHA